MKRNFTIYLSILCICLISGLVILFQGQVFLLNDKSFNLPVSATLVKIDGAVFSETSKMHHKKNLVAGPYDGSAAQRKLLAFQALENDTAQLMQVTFDDDPNQYFASTPPSPTDVAIILHELHKQGVEHLFISTLLSWSSIDELDSGVLYSEGLEGFSSVTITAPLTRSQSPKAIPPIFERSSIPLSQVKGNISSIPVVNSAPIPPSITCLLYTSPSPRDGATSRMPSSA